MKTLLNNIDLNEALFVNSNIGFVPTMGSLHDGHISLIKKSLKLSNKTIVSIFINPKQFNNKEDYKKYPRNIKKDLKILKKLKVMSLPIDHAIDRDWLLNIRSLCISPSPILLKEELHLRNSFINATKSYKLNPLIRYWVMVPYRFVNELIRIFYKIFIWMKIKIED